jgi:hypothetical protein
MNCVNEKNRMRFTSFFSHWPLVGQRVGGVERLKPLHVPEYSSDIAFGILNL